MDKFFNDSFISFSEMRRREEKGLSKAYNKVALAPLIMLGASFLVSGVSLVLGLVFPFFNTDFGLELINFFAYILSLLFPSLVLLLLFRKSGDFPTFEAPRARTFFPLFLLSLGVSFLGNYVSSYISAIAETFGITFTQPDFTPPTGGISFFLYFLQITIGAGLLEELFCRCLILGAVKPFGEKTAIFVSAFFFALIHGNFLQIPYAFVLGLFYGYITIRTGSILYSVIFHALSNSISVLLTLSGTLLNENIYNILSSLFVYISIVAGILGLVLEISALKKGVFSFKKETSILTTFQKIGRLFRSPVAIINIIIFGIMAVGYIEIGG
jgi:membrane protease YdiL (CAAX protease family)